MKFKRIIVILVLVMIIISTLLTNFIYAANGGNTLEFEKISNPDAGEGEADGITPGGDREASYAWAMTTRGNYVYVGTNKNIVGNVATTYVNTLVNASNGQLTEDMAWNIISMATDGEIPRPTTIVGGEIFKCNITTGEITKIFSADAGIAFRMAIEFEGNLYFASYSGDITADNFIYKIDENDRVTIAFTSSNGTSLRAACIHDNALFFGGVDAREELEEGDEDCAKLAILQKDANDDTKWDRIADYKDFKEYASDAAVKNSVASPIWDIVSYDGYIYATIPNSAGTVMFRGRPAEGNEQANEYGWYWEEIIGKKSTVNNIGLADTAEGQVGENAGLITMAATPFVFKDKLYLMNFDHTIQAEISALTGLLMVLMGQKPDLSEYLKPMYTTLKNPQKLWVYDDVTGKFNEVQAFQEFMKDTCNEYLWRTEIYNDQLYITTMDSAVLYNWAIQFTALNFITLSEVELQSAISGIDQTIDEIGGINADNSQSAEVINGFEQLRTMLQQYSTILNDSEKFNNFVVRNEELIGSVEKFVEKITNMELNIIPQSLINLFNRIDWDGLRMYAYIVRMVKNDTWGFDLLRTSDGENFEIVTDSGFGDKYNYGGRSLIKTDAGLYVGTANPFFGAQLWRISEDIETPNDPTDSNNPGDSDGPTDSNNPGDSDGPTDSNNPDDSDGPTDSNNPDDSDDPTDSNNPDDSDGPTDSNNPDDSDGSTDSNQQNKDNCATEEELEEIKAMLENVIEDMEEFEEEIKKLNEEIVGIKKTGYGGNSSNSGSSTILKVDPDDATTATIKLPNAGKARIVIIFIVVISIFAVVTIKYMQYRNIDKY